MKKWNRSGINFSIGDISNQIDTLQVGVYTLEQSMAGLYLSLSDDTFKFSHKLYGLETNLIKRVVKTWHSTDRNLGVLLNGLKGTGKTVTAKVICNELQLPVIMINTNPDGGGIPEFLSEIQQDVIVLIDEYEKIFGGDSELLTVMDGVLSGLNRKLFILTTNDIHINVNLLERPSRIRYFKTFNDLSPQVIEEIVDDTLVHKNHKAAVILAISNLQIITIDIVKTLVEEVNIHNESPTAFMDVFNVKKITGKYSVYQIQEKDGTIFETELTKNVTLWPREFNDDSIGSWLEANGQAIGRITEVISFDKVIILPIDEDYSDRHSLKTKQTSEPITVRIEVCDSLHRSYMYANINF